MGGIHAPVNPPFRAMKMLTPSCHTLTLPQKARYDGPRGEVFPRRLYHRCLKPGWSAALRGQTGVATCVLLPLGFFQSSAFASFRFCSLMSFQKLLNLQCNDKQCQDRRTGKHNVTDPLGVLTLMDNSPPCVWGKLQHVTPITRVSWWGQKWTHDSLDVMQPGHLWCSDTIWAEWFGKVDSSSAISAQKPIISSQFRIRQHETICTSVILQQQTAMGYRLFCLLSSAASLRWLFKAKFAAQPGPLY